MAAMLDLDRIRAAPVKTTPYPYFALPDAIVADEAPALAADFPEIDRPGAIDANDTSFGPAFGRLLDELKGDDFRRVIADKFDVDLDDRDIIINVRGLTRLTDGNIHTDTPSKLVTVLLYFNHPGQAGEGETSLRILNDGKDIDNYAEEIPPVLGTMVAFKVTHNCWHGFKPFVGRRHSLQLNYLSGVKTVGKHQLGHRLVGRMKRKLAHVLGR
jgi:SM-20-related protein